MFFFVACDMCTCHCCQLSFLALQHHSVYIILCIFLSDPDQFSTFSFIYCLSPHIMAAHSSVGSSIIASSFTTSRIPPTIPYRSDIAARRLKVQVPNMYIAPSPGFFAQILIVTKRITSIDFSVAMSTNVLLMSVRTSAPTSFQTELSVSCLM